MWDRMEKVLLKQSDLVDDATVGGPPISATTPRWQLWALVLLPFLGLAAAGLTEGTGTAADDFGQYLMHAQALAEGRPYSDIGYIYSPYASGVGPRSAPPGLPVTIAPLMKVFGPNVAVLRAFMLLFAIGFVLTAGLYFARRGEPELGLGVALLTGLTTTMVHGASQILTDLPFAAAVWLAIYLIDNNAKLSWPTLLAVTALGAYAVALRPVGIAVAGALALFTIIRFKELRWRPGIPIVIWAVVLLIGGLVIDISHMAVIHIDPVRMLRAIWIEQRPLANLGRYLPAVVASHLHPFPTAIANHAFHALTMGLMIVGFMEAARRYFKRFVFSFGVAYGGLLLILPITQPRYLWPLFPIFVFGVLNGLRALASRYGRLPVRAPAFALGFAVLVALGASARVVAKPPEQNLSDMPDAKEVIEYVRDASSQGPTRVTFFKPRNLAWVTGVHAMGPIEGKPECLIAELKSEKITHVIVRGSAGSSRSSLRHTIASWPMLFREELRNQTFIVYRFDEAAARAVSMPSCPR